MFKSFLIILILFLSFGWAQAQGQEIDQEHAERVLFNGPDAQVIKLEQQRNDALEKERVQFTGPESQVKKIDIGKYTSDRVVFDGPESKVIRMKKSESGKEPKE